MLKTQRVLAAIVLTGVLAAGTALAAKPDAYQVTGPVVEMNNSVIVVMKGKERFEVARDASTKMPADVKVGDKVTIHYRMMATEVESKGAPAAAKKPKMKKAA